MSTTSLASTFVGWYREGHGTESITCDSGMVFSTSGSFANCVRGDFPLATSCEQSNTEDRATLHLNNGTTLVCNKGLNCYTVGIMDSSPTGTPAITEHFCDEGWPYPSTLYRNFPASTSATTSSTSESTSSTSESTFSTTQSTSSSTQSTDTSPTQTPTASSTMVPDGGSHAQPESSGLSGRAIAGIVIGVFAALVLLALIFLRKKLLACFGQRRNTDRPGKPQKTPTELPAHEVHEIGSSATGNQSGVPYWSARKSKEGIREIGSSS